ncbi:MAG: DUF2339 domain-containing protein, partial [Aestuariivirgaceae bacterium]
YLCARKTNKPLWVVVPSLAVPLVLLLFTNLRFGVITPAAPLSGAALILAGLTAFATWRLLPLTTDAGIRHCAGVYAAACATFVTVALSLVLDEAALTVAMALLVLAISLVWRQVPLRILWSFTLALATVVVIRLTFNPFIFDYARTDWLGEHWVLYGFGLSAIVFYLAAQVLRKSDDDELVMALESGALVFAVLLVTYEVRIFIEGSISARNYGFLEMSVQSVSWLTSAYGLIIRNARTPRFFTLWGSRVLLAIASAQVLILQVLVNNPALIGERLKGFFPADSLLLAYLAPAVLLWFIVPRLPAISLAKFQDHFTGFAAGLVFVYVTLEVRHIFQGATLFVSHDSNLELYVTTLAWFALGGVMLTVPLLKANDMLVRCGKAIVALALLMVVAGHIGVFNPVLTGLPVPGVALFNILLLGFALPAVGLAVAARLSPGTTLEHYRDHLGIAAYAIGFAYLTLEVRRFFHGRFMDVGAISDAEYYGYSLVWLIYALAVLLVGMWLKRSMIRHAALAVLVLVVLKVFLSDMAGLGGLYRVASFMGLGLSLVGIGYLYQRFVFTGSSETADAQTGG